MTNTAVKRSPVNNNKMQLKLRCLELATHSGAAAEETVRRAELYYTFLIAPADSKKSLSSRTRKTKK